MPIRLSAAFAAMLWGCTAATGPDAAVAVELDQPFELEVGEAAHFGAAGLEVRLAAIAGDSRCPSNALILCVWEGDAAVVVTVTPVNGKTLSDTLHTALEPKAVEVGSYLLRLESLQPYPEDVTPIPIGDYRATFLLTEPR